MSAQNHDRTTCILLVEDDPAVAASLAHARDGNPHLILLDVRHLRERLELDPGRPSLILTVPGIGYRLVG